MQTQLRSGIAVVVVEAGGYSSDWTPSLGTLICRRCGPKKTKDKLVEMKTTMSEMKNTLDGINSSLDIAEEKIKQKTQQNDT